MKRNEKDVKKKAEVLLSKMGVQITSLPFTTVWTKYIMPLDFSTKKSDWLSVY